MNNDNSGVSQNNKKKKRMSKTREAFRFLKKSSVKNKSFQVKNDSGNLKTSHKWVVLVIIWAFALSMLVNFTSTGIMERVNLLGAFIVLVIIIMMGVVFDIIGVAVSTATEAPFLSLASRRIGGAKESLILIRSAQQVSSFCCDIVGDIAGIVSGSSAAIIAVTLSGIFGGQYSIGISLILSALVASLTVGAKAAGKGFAMKKNNTIVFFIGKIFNVFSRFKFKKKRATKKKSK